MDPAPRDQAERPARARQLAPYGYCRYCGAPRPEGERFCGGLECIGLGKAAGLSAPAGGRAAPGVPSVASTAMTAPATPAAHDATERGSRRQQARRRLVRDTSVLLLLGSLVAFMILGLAPVLSRPSGGVLEATSPPSHALPSPFTGPAVGVPVPVPPSGEPIATAGANP